MDSEEMEDVVEDLMEDVVGVAVLENEIKDEVEVFTKSEDLLELQVLV